MPVYRFEALDLKGNLSKGTVEGDTVRLARSRLRDMQLTPLKVEALEETSDGPVRNVGLFQSKRLSTATLALVTRQLSTLLAAGLTVDQVLNAIQEQAEEPYLKEIMLAIRADVVAGSTLSGALGKYPQVFPDIYRAIIFAGEESGELANVTLRLADYTESRHVLAQKVINAFIYPALVTTVALLVIGGLMIYVVPQVVNAFTQSHQTLPLLTRALIAISDFLRWSWPYLVALGAFATWAGITALKREPVRYRWHELQLTLPVIGGLVRGLNTARLASTLSILVGSGVPIMKSLNAASAIIGNLPMREAVIAATDQVRDGTPLSKALKTKRLFPPILIHLIASAEATGQLDQLLESAANQQSREMENRISVLTALLEPILILTMGVVVLLIVLAVLLPIIEMNQLIH